MLVKNIYTSIVSFLHNTGDFLVGGKEKSRGYKTKESRSYWATFFHLVAGAGLEHATSRL